jgi:hypothetical protein
MYALGRRGLDAPGSADLKGTKRTIIGSGPDVLKSTLGGAVSRVTSRSGRGKKEVG